MNDVKVIDLNSGSYDEDEQFADFIDTLKEGNTSAIFILSREDGSFAVGSTYKNVKELVWDCERLKMFMQDLVRGAD